MNHFQGRMRHEFDREFLKKFLCSFGEEDLIELISHLDAYPDDGDAFLDQLPELRVISWESPGSRRDVFYIYRKRLGVVIYFDCVEPPDQSRGWFRNLDPAQLMEISLKLLELIENLFRLFLTSQLPEKKGCCTGGSCDYQQEVAQRR